MYGKHFSSMYTGSLVGSGAVVFAVMGYVIANYQLDKTVGAQVELNAKLLSAIIGENEKEIQAAIDFLSSPDERTRTDGHEGRRLVRIGQFAYRVVNGAMYTAIRNEEERRDYQRRKQSEYRARKKLAGDDGKPVSARYKANENRAVKAENNCDSELAERIAAGEA